MTETATSADTSRKSTHKLPPGMVIGPDGKPCKICTAFRNWKTPSVGKKGSTDNFASIAGLMGSLAAGKNTQTPVRESEPVRPDEPPEGCPPDAEQLGRATWTFLHTTAAYYPDEPSPAQRTRMLGLLFALPVLYPCWYCASHLGENIKSNPPDVSSRVSLSRWLCERHNEVNERLGKPLFDCSTKNMDERWKDGPSDGRCE